MKEIKYHCRQYDDILYDKETEHIFINISEILYKEQKKTICEWDSIYTNWIFSKILYIRYWKSWNITIVRTNKEDIIKEDIKIDSFMLLKPATHTINILDFIWRYKNIYKWDIELSFNKLFHGCWINNNGRVSMNDGVLLRYIYTFIYDKYK